MKLLVFDKDYTNDSGDPISVLSKSLKDYSLTVTTDFDDALTLYENSKFDFVIIDFTSKDGRKFLDYVMEENIEQKVITIGYKLTHSEKLGCGYCEKNYYRRRLVKPISVVDLYRTIINFDKIKCEYRDKFSDTKVIIEQLVNKYNYFSFDEREFIISSQDEGTRVLRQFLNLLNELSTYEIKHEVVDDKTIKVLSK